MTAAPQFRPVVGDTVRAWIVRLVVAAMIIVLSYAVIGASLALGVALLLCVATVAFPRAPAAWLLAALLAFVSLGPIGSEPTWRFFVALAAAHLLHLIGVTLPWLPTGGRVELRVIGRMLRIFVIIQIPAQLLAFLILTLLARGGGNLVSPLFGLVAALGFVAVVALIVVPLVRERSDE
jgi:hypothetical protein